MPLRIIVPLIICAFFLTSCATSEEPRERVRYEDVRESVGRVEPVVAPETQTASNYDPAAATARRPKGSNHAQELAEETVLSAVNGFRETFSLLASTTANAAESLERLYTEPAVNRAQLRPISETLPTCPAAIFAEDAERAELDARSIGLFAYSRSAPAAGYVSVRYHVGSDGRAVAPRIEAQSDPGVFGLAALRAVNSWRHPVGASCAAARACFRFELDREGEVQSLPPVHPQACGLTTD